MEKHILKLWLIIEVATKKASLFQMLLKSIEFESFCFNSQNVFLKTVERLSQLTISIFTLFMFQKIAMLAFWDVPSIILFLFLYYKKMHSSIVKTMTFNFLKWGHQNRHIVNISESTEYRLHCKPHL
jgi:hypothetical protein